MSVTIYHNPNCGTSRNVLAMLRASGETPHVIDYIAQPPSIATLHEILARLGLTARDLLRAKEARAEELGLLASGVDETALIQAMHAEPILINRPIVLTPMGGALCRPSERVLSLLAAPVAVFEKDNGEIVHAPRKD